MHQSLIGRLETLVGTAAESGARFLRLGFTLGFGLFFRGEYDIFEIFQSLFDVFRLSPVPPGHLSMPAKQPGASVTIKNQSRGRILWFRPALGRRLV